MLLILILLFIIIGIGINYMFDMYCKTTECKECRRRTLDMELNTSVAKQSVDDCVDALLND